MTFSRILAYLSIGLLMVVLSACPSLAVTDTEHNVGTNARSFADQDDGLKPIDTIQSGSPNTNPNKVVQKARKWLANYLGVPVGRVKDASVEQMDWPDACLGLAEPGEACAAVIVPGYRIMFDVRGQEYEVRTDMAANVIRVVK